MDLRVSDLIERNRNIFVKFKYHDINYSGLIFKVIQDGKKRNYALYIDVSLIQRLTRIRHLKKIENLDGQLLNEKDIEDKVGIIYSDHDDLFNYDKTLVCGCPETGIAYGQGYAQGRSLRYMQFIKKADPEGRTFILPHVWHGDRDWIGEIYNNWNTLCSVLLDVALPTIYP